MVDSRVKKAAEILVDYSIKIKKGEYAVINGNVEAAPLIMEIYKLILKRGGFPIVKLGLQGMNYNYFKLAQDHQLKHFPTLAMQEIKKVDAVFHIAGNSNTRELSNVDPKKISMRQTTLEPLQKERLKKRWVIFDYPTSALAQEADMSLEEFEDFVYKTTNLDWKKESKKMERVYKIMSEGKEVRLVHKDTDLKFSIRGRKFIVADGTHNMPDGEIFTAPVETTTEGFISFTFPTIYSGREVDGVSLVFKDGNVIKATAQKNQSLLKTLLGTDEGSKRLGEFGIGLNYGINKFIKNILFDEKIGGTIHLALGMAYPECKGINKSAIHWDMIKDMRNGGKIYLDGKLVSENGKFL
jgi:aminopeptidase|tara:strand:- start:16267 stop:17328 length:1062 start_codon:yes stop_codon:yes gene_type:complete